MTRQTLAGAASGHRLVDAPASQHGVDEPNQLPGRQYQRPPVLVAGCLGELLSVVGTELRAVHPHRVGGLNHVVTEVGVATLGERPLFSLELSGLVAPPGEPAELRQGLLALEAPYVADLGDDAGGEDRAEAGDGGKRLGRSRLKLGGYGLLAMGFSWPLSVLTVVREELRMRLTGSTMLLGSW